MQVSRRLVIHYSASCRCTSAMPSSILLHLFARIQSEAQQKVITLQKSLESTCRSASLCYSLSACLSRKSHDATTSTSGMLDTLSKHSHRHFQESEYLLTFELLPDWAITNTRTVDPRNLEQSVYVHSSSILTFGTPKQIQHSM